MGAVTNINGQLVKAGEVIRYSMEGHEIERSGETAAQSVAAREEAAVKARFQVAILRPRDMELFRTRLLHECRRPGFAAKAEYARPVGKEKNKETGRYEDKFAYGPSIRFIEAALRCFGNVYPEVVVVFDSPSTRIVRVTVTDLESNLAYTSEVQIDKRVERKGTGQAGSDPPKGREVISQRLNSYGDPTFLCVATDDETTIKQNSMQSKTIRVLAQRLLPFDIVEEAIMVARKTVTDQDSRDPDAARRQMADAFAQLNISPSDLQEYLGHTLDKITPAELKELRAIYVTVREGEESWASIIAQKDPVGSKEAAQEVARQKLAGLGNKPAPQEQPRTAATVDTGGGATTAKAESSTPTEASTVEQSETASVPSAPEPAKYKLELHAYRTQLGGEEFMKILGAHGYMAINDVPSAAFPAMQEEMLQRCKDLGKPPVDTSAEALRQAAQPKIAPLQFGKKPTGNGGGK